MHRRDPRLVSCCEVWRAEFNFPGNLHPKQCSTLIKAIHEKCRGNPTREKKYGLELAKVWKDEADKRKKEVCSFYFGRKVSELEGEFGIGTSSQHSESDEDDNKYGVMEGAAGERRRSMSPPTQSDREQNLSSASGKQKLKTRKSRVVSKSDRELRGRSSTPSRGRTASTKQIKQEVTTLAVETEHMSVSTKPSAPQLQSPPLYNNLYPQLPPVQSHLQEAAAILQHPTAAMSQLSTPSTLPHMAAAILNYPAATILQTQSGVQPVTEPAMTMPMIEVPSGTGTMVHVYRPWTDDDFTAAIKSIPNPKEDIVECVKQLGDIRRSFKLTATECERVLRRVCGTGWVNVEGDWSPWAARNNPGDALVEHKWDSGDLTTAWTGVIRRMQEFYKVTPDYTKLSTITQKPTETVDELVARVMNAFEKYSGLLKPDALTGTTPWEQQLKAQIDRALKEDLQWSIHKHLITWRTCSLTVFLEYARHAERVAGDKRKRGPKRPTAGASYSLSYEDHYVNEGENDAYNNDAPRPRPTRRHIKDYHGRRERGECFICGKKGHKARDCPNDNKNQSA